MFTFYMVSIPVMYTAVGCYLIFTTINILGIKESALFNLVVTVLAVLELLLFMGIVTPHFELAIFYSTMNRLVSAEFLLRLPFAIWFYLGIEGVAMVAEEVKDPQRNIPKGYLLGMATLVILAIGVMVLSGGIGDWRTLSTIDYPLPEAISQVLGKHNSWTKIFAGIGLFGLIASFHGLIIGYSRQIIRLVEEWFPSSCAEHREYPVPHPALGTDCRRTNRAALPL